MENKILNDIAVIQWIPSCHKNRMTIRVITFWGVYIMSLTMSLSKMCFLIEIMVILKVIKSHFKRSYKKSHFKGSYNKQNLTLVVILYEVYETRHRFVS